MNHLIRDDGWVARILKRFESSYIGSHGMLVTELDAAGVVTNDEPLISDFGDVLPFLVQYGHSHFAREQIALAEPELSGGLYCPKGAPTKLFRNHDWLLCLLEMHRMTGDRTFLSMALQGARSILSKFEKTGLLLDQEPNLRFPMSMLRRSSPFNLGYLEIFVDLYKETHDRDLLESSRRIATAYMATSYFRENSVFGRILCGFSRRLNEAISTGVQQLSLFFKDNTNAVWGLLALYTAERSPRVEEAIDKWISGFEQMYWNRGDVFLWLGQNGLGREVSAKAAFSSIDLLCDLHLAGFDRSCVRLATGVADRWISHQWDNGLFPITPGATGDHLDCNTDMTVSLMKLSAITGSKIYAEAAKRCASSNVAIHERDAGLVLSVDANGEVVSDRVIVKYQALALKLALLPSAPSSLLADSSLLHLLRDR